MPPVRPLVRALRPKQWVKNLLVLAAPLAAGEVTDPDVMGAAGLAFVAFCLLSSAVYLANDCADVDADRLHPRKRFRPIAAGELSTSTALATSAALTVTALAIATWVSLDLLAVLVGYAALQLGYILWFKHEPVLDISVVTAGFLLRAVAGGVAAGLFISQWFLLVAGFGALFIVAGKRYSELHTLGSEAGTRRTLVGYTDTYLRFAWSVAAGVTVTAYSLWAFENSGDTTAPWHTISIAAFVVGMLRYAVDIDAGKAAEPEDIVWGDRTLQAIVGCWFVTVLLGVLHV